MQTNFTPVHAADNLTFATSGPCEPVGLEHSPNDLICHIDASAIQNRWLKAFIPEPDQQLKISPPGINAYIGRILKSYVSAVISCSSIPPFVKNMQMDSEAPCVPLANCFSLLRICNAQMLGSQMMAQDHIEQEMTKLYEQHPTYDGPTILGAFQAYLMYVMALYFHFDQQSSLHFRQYVTNLQQLACASSSQGLVVRAEFAVTRPEWRSWIIAEAKRRTLYTMYLFDNLICANDGLPIFVGTELRGLPAPASKHLWRASSEDEWKVAYNRYLSEWIDSGLYIDELWPMSSNLTRTEVLQRRRRVDKWLESVDEYGTMLYAVTICTHSG